MSQFNHLRQKGTRHNQSIQSSTSIHSQMFMPQDILKQYTMPDFKATISKVRAL